jgi:hypothetical protein
LAELKNISPYSEGKSTIINFVSGAVFADQELPNLGLSSPMYSDLKIYPISESFWLTLQTQQNIGLRYDDSTIAISNLIQLSDSVKYLIISFIPLKQLKSSITKQISDINNTRNGLLAGLAGACIAISLAVMLVSTYFNTRDMKPIVRSAEEVKKIAKNLGTGKTMANSVNIDLGANGSEEGQLLQKNFEAVVKKIDRRNDRQNSRTSVRSQELIELADLPFANDLKQYQQNNNSDYDDDYKVNIHDNYNTGDNSEGSEQPGTIDNNNLVIHPSAPNVEK